MEDFFFCGVVESYVRIPSRFDICSGDIHIVEVIHTTIRCVAHLRYADGI